mmetsp:Transcript_16300/g.26570  ORF Transcript_16300/g.26570 Transcript_16300/m.26570 type:complete len:245 (+) Transcript_16300:618-1352(+)|eukprot:CAMPEP_0203767294 /NCGR_PEP_ID=MMETSP0099_2-20121227/913_1 /ASSEMBLY_ACC=CAM_ASM_000209 /TAXON_ID=96639 /ORGANISM=" , Strain NY0313808BC1" /LENGTH=244 /DNA_ID=CAMNT_0050663779 /DNA_START=540 /DNA_END=1274 /DNA_ORIENTATION=+
MSGGLPYKVLSFDLDDTIWDCWPVIDRAMCAQYDFMKGSFPAIVQAYPPDEFNRLCTKVRTDNKHMAHDLTFVRKRALEIVAAECQHDPREVVEPSFRAFMDARNQVSDHIFPGVVPVLERLKSQGYRLVSLTNGNCDVSLSPELGHLFEHNITAESAGAAKPHPLPFKKLLDLTAVASPEEILHIGDNFAHDVVGAKACGLRAVWVDRKATLEEGEASRHPADGVVKCVSELEDFLAKTSNSN